MKNVKSVSLHCKDHDEILEFTSYRYEVDGNVDYSFDIKDAYCGGDYHGIFGRFKRALHAFLAKPIYYTGILIEDPNEIKNFLNECINLVSDDLLYKETMKEICRSICDEKNGG